MIPIKRYEPEKIYPIFEIGGETPQKRWVISIEIKPSDSAYPRA